MIIFEIPYPKEKKAKQTFCRRFGLNAYYSGKHWTARQRDAEELHKLTEDALTAAHVPREPLQGPVRIAFFWDDGLDVDNHSVLGKCIVDALKGQIIHDDNRKWLKAISHEFWDGKVIKVEIREVSEHD